MSDKYVLFSPGTKVYFEHYSELIEGFVLRRFGFGIFTYYQIAYKRKIYSVEKGTEKIDNGVISVHRKYVFTVDLIKTTTLLEK